MEEKKEDNVDFINLVLMLNQNALISLGEIPRFVSGKKVQNLPLARQTINMLKALKDKTAGRLTPGETKLLFRVLGELQAKYVKAAGLDKTGAAPTHKASKMEKMMSALDNLSTSDLAKLLEQLKKEDDMPK